MKAVVLCLFHLHYRPSDFLMQKLAVLPLFARHCILEIWLVDRRYTKRLNKWLEPLQNIYIIYMWQLDSVFFFVENALSLCVNMNILLFSVWETPDCKVFALEEINFSTKCLLWTTNQADFWSWQKSDCRIWYFCAFFPGKNYFLHKI